MEDINELQDAGLLNSKTISDAFSSYENVDDFLHANLHLNFHSTFLTNPLEFLKLQFDIDGIVVELKKCIGLLARFHYLLLPKIQPHMFKDGYIFIKKHVDLTKCSPNGIKALRNAVAYTIAYVDGGYHLTLIVLPKSLTVPDTRLYNKELYKSNASEVFNDLVLKFQNLLKAASIKDKCRPTLQKQTSYKTNAYHVLSVDMMYILSVLDDAINDVSSCPFLKPVVFLTCFGQKSETELELTDLVNPAEVVAVSVHFACTLSARDDETHTLFSRHGLDKLVGSRGSLYSVLGIHEASNYQSDLDHLPIEVSDDLHNILVHQGKLTFLQLYVVSPHVHVQMPYKHPVSGAIVTCKLSHPQFQRALLLRACSYIDHMDDLKNKLLLQLGLRIEQVRRFEQDIPMLLNSEDYFNKTSLQSLFCQNPIVIPFNDSSSPYGFLSTLKSVLDHFVKELRHQYENSESIACYNACWKAFQLELALEELFFGHPLSTADYQLSVSLGTSTVNPKSLSHTRGFIGLSPHSAASAGEVPPPLHHWTHNQLQEQRILRIFPLCQTLHAAPSVCGVELIKLLLCDIFKRNTEIPVGALSSDTPPGRLAGSQDLNKFCEDLSTKDSFPAPNTFGRAREILVQSGKDVKQCLLEGFAAQNLKFFPSIKFRDLKGGHRIFWNCKDYMILQVEGREQSLSQVTSATLQVCSEVERRNLSYSRNLDKYRDHGMVWMLQVLQRIPPQIQGSLHLCVITFVSSVAMIMNGDYVVYSHLRQLMDEMSPDVTQAMLQKWRILSNFLLPKVYNFKVWKLHEDIPYRLLQTPRFASSLRPPEHAPQEQPYEDVQEVDEQDNVKPMIRSQSMTLPTNTNQKWDEKELQLISQDPTIKDKAAYDMYVKSCHQQQIPVRTFSGFRLRRRRFLQKQD